MGARPGDAASHAPDNPIRLGKKRHRPTISSYKQGIKVNKNKMIICNGGLAQRLLREVQTKARSS